MTWIARPALILLVGGLGAGCAMGPRGAERGDVLRGLLPSAVQLLGERESGGGRRAASGVVLASDDRTRTSFVLTAKHFLAPPVPEFIFVRTATGKERVRASVLYTDAESDLAIVQVNELVLPPVRLQDVTHLGDEVWVVAFPRGRQLTVMSGTVSQILSTEGEALAEGPVRLIDAPVSYGASGSGVFDSATGALIGLVEGYRTAQIASRDDPDHVIEVPIPGETLVISTHVIRRCLTRAGLTGLVER